MGVCWLLLAVNWLIFDLTLPPPGWAGLAAGEEEVGRDHGLFLFIIDNVSFCIVGHNYVSQFMLSPLSLSILQRSSLSLDSLLFSFCIKHHQ